MNDPTDSDGKGSARFVAAEPSESPIMAPRLAEAPHEGGILKLYAEDFTVEKRKVETGRVRVSKRTRTREADVDADLTREEVVVETVPKGHRIDAMPATRVEGDTTIIPVVEEVVYTETRLILKEEIRVTRRRTTEHFHDTVTLRRQEAQVSRIQSATDESGALPGHKKTREE